MSNIDIVRAWKDEEYRNSLSEAELALLPENPAGMIELTDEEMSVTSGGLLAISDTDERTCHTTSCPHCKEAVKSISIDIAAC